MCRVGDQTCATYATPTPAISTGWVSRMFSGHGVPSWGRVCSAVALVVSVAQEFRDKPVAHIAIWLGVAVGSFTVTKLSDLIHPPAGGAAC
jgi:hypothetical protein